MADLRPTKTRMALLRQVANGQVLTDITGDTDNRILLFPGAPTEWDTRETVTAQVRELEAAGWVELLDQVNWNTTDLGNRVLDEYSDLGRVTGRNSPGLAAILATGVTYRELCHWVDGGHLHPEVKPAEGRASWSWSLDEQRVAIKMGRLVHAGLRPDAAEKVARHPLGGSRPGRDHLPVRVAPGCG